MYAVFLLDREPSDPVMVSQANSTDKIVNLTDRDGNTYVATLVSWSTMYSDVYHFVRLGYQTGSVVGRKVDNDRVTGRTHEVPMHGLVILGLARGPRAGSPLKLVGVN